MNGGYSNELQPVARETAEVSIVSNEGNFVVDAGLCDESISKLSLVSSLQQIGTQQACAKPEVWSQLQNPEVGEAGAMSSSRRITQ